MSSQSSEACRVFISGMGMITPLGLDLHSSWQHILEGKPCAKKIPPHWYDYLDFRSGIWAPLPDMDFMSQGFRRAETIQNDTSTLLAIVATHEALQQAGIETVLTDKKRNQYQLATINPERCSVIYGTGSGGSCSLLTNFSYHAIATCKQKLSETEACHESEALQTLYHPPTLNPFVIPMSICNSVPAGIGIKYSVHNDVQPVVQACSSGTTAIGEAFRKIRSGQSDLVISGGIEHLKDHWGASYKGFDLARTLAMIPADGNIDAANRPFDKDRSGFLFSQGGGASLILESEEHLLNRGGTALAEIVGFAETFDASSVMAPEQSGTQIERMIRKALDSAGITAGDIGYINAHGTGTVSNDQVEARVIERVFGSQTPINSTKSIIGHSLGGSGAIEAAVCVLSMQDQVLHASSNLENPIAALDFVTTKRDTSSTPVHYSFSESFAFGGHNSGLVLKRV